MVEKLNNLPIYAQAVNHLIDEIDSGVLKDKLPSEPELANRYGISRGTLREAIHYLQNQGVFVVRRGDGRYITPQARNLYQGEEPGRFIEQRWLEIASLHDRLSHEADLKLAGYAKEPTPQNFTELIEARVRRDTLRSLAEPVQRLRSGRVNEPVIAGNEHLFAGEIERRFYPEILDIRAENNKTSDPVKKKQTQLIY